MGYPVRNKGRFNPLAQKNRNANKSKGANRTQDFALHIPTNMFGESNRFAEWTLDGVWSADETSIGSSEQHVVGTSKSPIRSWALETLTDLPPPVGRDDTRKKVTTGQL